MATPANASNRPKQQIRDRGLPARAEGNFSDRIPGVSFSR